jgi:hypothetical protein
MLNVSREQLTNCPPTTYLGVGLTNFHGKVTKNYEPVNNIYYGINII